MKEILAAHPVAYIEKVVCNAAGQINPLKRNGAKMVHKKD